jgi:superfamily I DNA and/or RNA helicase
VSLLERTEGLQGGSLSMMLTTQYRMNAAISDWSSHEMYGGALRAAEAVGGRLLADLEVRRSR